VGPLDIVRAVLVIAASFVIGGIPWGVLIARVVGGPDPRTMGSGRTGGSNVMRALGPRVALVSGLLDASKGSVAVLLAWVVGAGTGVAVFAAMAAVVGHSRSIFLNFHGGRGVAPSWGALLVFQPLVALVVAPVFVAIIVVTRYSSVGSLSGSLIGGILLAVATAVTPLDPWLYVYAVGGPALVWLFHHDNIARLLAGEERKIGSPRT
jgi:glycerol-3-phosphate acyltransferase PlsY